MFCITDRNLPLMSGTPILIQNGSSQLLEPVPLTSEGHGAFDEAWLQNHIHQHPACLPISDIEPALGPFYSICREMPTNHGYIDNLLMSPSGDIAIVETKLFRNPEARRAVLAQILDYAVAIFGMSYDAFEQAALKGTLAPASKPTSLYSAIPAPDKLAEKHFHDSVVRNLRRGSALLLIVGDGIRTEAESLFAGLDLYGRFHFTLALIELAVFRMPQANDLLICPRVLAKTETIKRRVFDIVTTGQAAPLVLEADQTESLSSETFWRALESKAPGLRPPLESFIHNIEPIGVSPDFRASLNLKWERPSGTRPVNLGYVMPYGALWTDLASNHVPPEIAHKYVEELANAFNCDVHTMPSGTAWTPHRKGKPLRIQDVRDRLGECPPIMQRFINAISKYDEANL